MQLATFGGIAALGLRNVPTVLAANGYCSSQSEGWDKARLSYALVEGATSEFANTFNKAQAGLVAVEDVRAASVSARLLFAHFDEIGLNAATDRKMRDCRSEILAYLPSEHQVKQMQRLLEPYSIALSADKVRDMLTLTFERKMNALEKVQKLGIRGVQKAAVSILNRWAVRLQSRTSASLRYARFSQLEERDDECDEFQLIIDAIFLSAALNFGACLVGCAPCCLIAASEVIVGELLQIELDAFCLV